MGPIANDGASAKGAGLKLRQSLGLFDPFCLPFARLLRLEWLFETYIGIWAAAFKKSGVEHNMGRVLKRSEREFAKGATRYKCTKLRQG